MIFNLLEQQAANQQADTFQMIMTIGIWVVVIVAAYFLFIRPSRKRQKQEEELRNSIEITTIGGIVGRVISVREDDETFIMETGSEKTKMRFKKWAIASVDTPEKNPDKADEKKSECKKEKKSKEEDE